uniref:CSON003866 protein n=1 Tax=Culicoides sonorensis TaxID=179676 RepID=A0A336M4X7_CULSO
MEFDEGIFVDYVKETPIVWDTRSPKFRNKNEKLSAWLNIGSKFGLTGQQAYGKWVSLREKYRREVTYWEEVSIYGTDNPKQKWHLLDSMSFIDAVYKPRTKSTEVTYNNTNKRRKTENNNHHHNGNQYSQLQSLFNSSLGSNGFGQHSLLQSMFQMDTRDDDVSISPEIIECRSRTDSPSVSLSEQRDNDRNTKDNNNFTNNSNTDHNAQNTLQTNAWNQNKYLSFGKYIGEELCSMKPKDAEELHEALMYSVLDFKRKLKSKSKDASITINGNNQ